jgi:hypothetical protein
LLDLQQLFTLSIAMSIEPITGTPVRFPPGHVAIRLDERHRQAYRRLYRRYQTNLTPLPVLRTRDFDGREVKVTPAQLDALNAAFAGIGASPDGVASAFDAQERGRTRLFKKTQTLS